jgi:hypothetical protein
MTHSESTVTSSYDKQISRRRIVRGAAWTVPVLAASVAAPALAASQCGPSSLAWGSDYTQTSAAAGSGTVHTQAGRPIAFQVASTPTGGSVTYSSNNLQVSSAGIHIGTATTTPVPTAGTLDVNPAYRILTTFTFAEPIENLRFAVMDIDRNNRATANEWINVNAVAADGTRVPAPRVPGANIIISDGIWFRAADGTGNADLADTSHWVTYTIPGPLTTVNIFMDRPTREVAEGGVAISDFEFDVAC